MKNMKLVNLLQVSTYNQLIKSKNFHKYKYDYDEYKTGLSIDIMFKAHKVKNSYDKKIVLVRDFEVRENKLYYLWDSFKELEPIDILIDFIELYYNEDGFYNDLIESKRKIHRRYNQTLHSLLYKH